MRIAPYMYIYTCGRVSINRAILVWTLCPRRNVKSQSGRQAVECVVCRTDPGGQATTCFFCFSACCWVFAWFGGRAGRWRLPGRRLLVVGYWLDLLYSSQATAGLAGAWQRRPASSSINPSRTCAWSGLTPRTTVGVRAQQIIQLDAW
jgi:hypothetical protein